MKIRLIQLGAATLLSCSLCAAAAPSASKKAWITIGDSAFHQIKQLVPGIVRVETRRLQAEKTSEIIHVAALQEGDLDKLASAVHLRLGHCGGFMHHPSEAAARAALRRPRAVDVPQQSYLIDNRDLVTPILASMQEKNIEETIGSLSGFANRYYKTQTGITASDWLMARWAALGAGRADISVKQFRHANYPQQSVILTLTGSERPEESVVIGAHLDSILVSGMNEKAVAPGADDDASGVASMTEAFRAMVEQGYKPKRTIHMIAYAAEEVGLRGSQEIARAFKQAGRSVIAVLQLDMTNYKGAANDIYLLTDYTNSQLNEFLGQLVGAYLPGLKVGYDKCGYACSDHASWDALGFPTAMPFESSFARDNPNIHTAKDTYASSGNQSAHALKFARLAAAFAAELASD